MNKLKRDLTRIDYGAIGDWCVIIGIVIVGVISGVLIGAFFDWWATSLTLVAPVM